MACTDHNRYVYMTFDILFQQVYVCSMKFLSLILLSIFLPAQIAPDPPSNLSVSVKSGKVALISWSPPFQGNYSSFKLKIFGLSDYQYANKTIPIEEGTFQYQMKDLTPGASYQIQTLTIFEDKESVAYTSRNFTTSKCNDNG